VNGLYAKIVSHSMLVLIKKDLFINV